MLKDRLHFFWANIFTLGDKPDFSSNSPGLVHPVLLQKLLQLAVGRGCQVLSQYVPLDSDGLLALRGGGGVGSLILEDSQPSVEGEEFDDDGGGGLLAPGENFPTRKQSSMRSLCLGTEEMSPLDLAARRIGLRILS